MIIRIEPYPSAINAIEKRPKTGFMKRFTIPIRSRGLKREISKRRTAQPVILAQH